jgi:hypothetical protein
MAIFGAAFVQSEAIEVQLNCRFSGQGGLKLSARVMAEVLAMALQGMCAESFQ